MEPKHKPGVEEIWSSRLGSIDHDLFDDTINLMSEDYIGAVSMGVEDGESQVVGFAIGESKPDSVEILLFATREGWEGIGVATKTLKYMITMARNRDVERIIYQKSPYDSAEVSALTNAGFDKNSGVFHREF